MWANPSSPHHDGRSARAALEDARERIADALGWHGHLVFTSGASESIAIAMDRGIGGRRFLSAVEHEAVWRAAPEAAALGLNGSVLDPDRLLAAIAIEDRPFVAIQHVNSETGRVQPVTDFAAIVRDRQGVLFSDCAQSAGKHPLPDADMVAVSAHKLGGPPGIGALLVRDLAQLRPVGGQEFGYRGGTENLPGALGFAAALEAGGVRPGDDAPWIAPLRDAVGDLAHIIADAGGHIIGGAPRSPLILAVAMPGLSAAAQLIQFDLAGIAVSAGSACSSGSLKPSRVLRAIGLDDDVAAATIRVSFGWTTTAEDVERFGEAWRRIAARRPRVA